jgi:hypothetical protein
MPTSVEDIRLTAYFLWEQDGKPEGREQEYWLRALKRHQRQDEADVDLAQNPDTAAAEAEGQRPRH